MAAPVISAAAPAEVADTGKIRFGATIRLPNRMA